jgi:GAF domain-containing protein
MRAKLRDVRRDLDDASDHDPLTGLLVALQRVGDISELWAVLQDFLPKIAAHEWVVFIPSVSVAELWQWRSAVRVTSHKLLPQPHSALAQYQQPIYGPSLRSAPAAIKALLRTDCGCLTGPDDRYALIPMTYGDETAALCLGSAAAARWSKTDRQMLARAGAALRLVLGQLKMAAQLQQIERNTRLLDSIRAVIAHTLDLSELLRQVVEQVAQCYGYSLVSVYMLEADELYCQHQVGYSNVLWTIPVTTGVMARAVRQRHSIWIEDVRDHPDFLAALPEIISEIAVPLQSGANVYGVINVESSLTHLQQSDLTVLEAVAAEVSVAVECALLYTATHRQAQQLTVIERLRTAIASQLDTKALGATIVRSLHTVLKLECVSLYVLQDQLLQLRAFIGSTTQPHTTLTIDQGLTGLCVRRRQPLLINNVRQEPAYLGENEQVRAGIYLPLIYGDALLGALSIESYASLTSSDFEVVTSLSEQIAAALEQSRRVEAAQMAQAREAFLNNLLSMINQTQPISWNALWSQLTEQLGQLLGVDHCSISLFEADEAFEVVTWSASGPGVLDRMLQHIPLSALNQAVLSRFEQGQLLSVVDIRGAETTLSPFRKALLANNIVAVAAAPVLIDDAPVAALGVFREQPHHWQREDLALLERVAQHLAVALRQAELRAQEEQRRQELELVHQIALDISAHHDLQSVLQAIVERACELLNADSGTVYLLPPDSDDAELCVGVNVPLELIGSRAKRDVGMIGKTLQTLCSYLVPRYDLWEDHDSAFEFAPFGATLSMPLIANQHVLGVLIVAHVGTVKQFRASDQRLIELLAVQAAQAIETAQLLEDVRRRTIEIEAVYANALALTAQQELTQVLQSIVERAMALMDASAVALHLLHHSTHDLELAVGINIPAALLGTRVKLGESVAGLVAQERRSVIVADYQRFPHHAELYAELPWHSMLCVPLFSGDQVLGAIGMAHQQSAKQFGVRDQQMLELFASQAAQAIEHARRFERERMLRADAEGSLAEMQAVLHELEQTNERMGRIEKFRLLGELASEVAHDFNNALVSILGNTQFLLLDENDPERIVMLRSVEAAARDSATMVKRIQEFGRTQQAGHTESVNINTIVRDAVIMTQSRWRDVVEPTTDLQAVAPVHASATELRRVLMNLIVNAIDAMPNGGSLQLSTSDGGGMVSIVVADTGTGMPPHIQARIFDPFFTTKALGMGTGLGLSICQQIITRYGGTISVASTPGQGTTFTIQLPIANPVPAASPTAD